MNIAKSFDKLIEKYHPAYGVNPEYSYFLEELMSVVRKGKMLDLGCGVGLSASKHLTTHGYDLTAVDFSKKMIEEAKKNLPKAEVLHSDIMKLDLDEQSYDGAVALFTFNFLKKKELVTIFPILSAAIKEDGGILIGALEGDFEGEEKLLGEKVWLRHITEREIRALLKDFHITMIERRDYKIADETPQKHIFVVAKKKTVVEQMLEEESPHKNHNDEQATDEIDKLLGDVVSKSRAGSDKPAKEVSEIVEKKKPAEEDESDDEEPAIRITFFKKSRKKK